MFEIPYTPHLPAGDRLEAINVRRKNDKRQHQQLRRKIKMHTVWESKQNEIDMCSLLVHVSIVVVIV